MFQRKKTPNFLTRRLQRNSEKYRFKSIFSVTWQKNKIDEKPPVISIAEVISQVLEDESRGTIDPIPEYVRHTLKALNAFISKMKRRFFDWRV